MQELPRHGEAAPPPPRSSRVFNSEGEWFFDTREKDVMGPYASREIAEEEVVSYIEFMKVKANIERKRRPN